MTPNPEYTLDYQQARIALMTEPEGTIIEDEDGYQFRLEECLEANCVPTEGSMYRIIPIPAKEDTP